MVPNLIRSTSIPITLAFGTLSPLCGTVGSAVSVGAGCFMLAAVAILFMEETYGKNIDFIEK
ncbi:MAG: hypothetical protein K2W95_12945 [Candidatus Obscuribacterales bacterium]|nr:hypothetical protein [Candidatus Obscuribacterales bacterium]